MPDHRGDGGGGGGGRRREGVQKWRETARPSRLYCSLSEQGKHITLRTREPERRYTHAHTKHTDAYTHARVRAHQHTYLAYAC